MSLKILFSISPLYSRTVWRRSSTAEAILVGVADAACFVANGGLDAEFFL